MIIKIIKIFYYVATPVIAILALYISICGNPLAKPIIEPFIRDKCKLIQDYGILSIQIPFVFQNKGNKIGTISKMELSLRRDNSTFEKIFTWGLPPLSIYPTNYSNVEVKFYEKLDDAVGNEIFELKYKAIKESNKLFLEDPKKKIYLNQ